MIRTAARSRFGDAVSLRIARRVKGVGLLNTCGISRVTAFCARSAVKVSAFAVAIGTARFCIPFRYRVASLTSALTSISTLCPTKKPGNRPGPGSFFRQLFDVTGKLSLLGYRCQPLVEVDMTVQPFRRMRGMFLYSLSAALTKQSFASNSLRIPADFSALGGI